MTGRRPFAFVAKESKNKHSNRLVLEGQVWMRWGERNSGLKRCKGEEGGLGREGAGEIRFVLWSVTTERSDHLLGSVSLFVCLARARGWKESQNISQIEGLLLLNL